MRPCRIGEIEKFLEELLEKYGGEPGLNETVEFFEELERGLKALGARVLDKYIAPNGYITFECGGKKYSFDLSYGLIEGGNYLEVLVQHLREMGVEVKVEDPQAGLIIPVFKKAGDQNADLLPAVNGEGSHREPPTPPSRDGFTGSVGVIGHGQRHPLKEE